ncbi:hypothetical protein E2C01_039497 [Portunus trituberculatus]|uniref:Uncharacterized protein n=1 Tax=Portunus trituberculatus TaxID=210409 RepID=A0A5B7FGZ8_PORTR|nr:hypothetical protein [Portunus trituberculatus]
MDAPARLYSPLGQPVYRYVAHCVKSPLPLEDVLLRATLFAVALSVSRQHKHDQGIASVIMKESMMTNSIQVLILADGNLCNL